MFSFTKKLIENVFLQINSQKTESVFKPNDPLLERWLVKLLDLHGFYYINKYRDLFKVPFT